jgi:hypothetical protein
MAGYDNRGELRKISKNLDELVEQGGFKFKDTHMSGDPLDSDIPRKVLGLFWDMESDRLQLDIKINFSGKRKGAKLAPDVDLEEEDINEATPKVVTKRMVWRVAQAQYDPLVLISPFMMQFKLVMRSLCSEEGKVTGWDEAIPSSAVEAFKKAMSGLRELKNISFPRSIQPSKRPVEPPLLLLFRDGSRDAYATLAYIRWTLEDGLVECKLIAGKSRVAPKQKISIPRMELLGALLAVRLAKKIQDSFTFVEVKGTRYFTDSPAVLGMLRCDSASFLEFVGTRVSQVKSLSSPEKEWFWIPGDCNLADMGTRPNVEPGDLQEGTNYQDGILWMGIPEEDWPARQEFSPPHPEERRKDVVMVASTFGRVTLGVEYSSLKKLINIYAYVLHSARKWRGYKRNHAVRGQILGSLDPDAMEAGELFLIQKAQEGRSTHAPFQMSPFRSVLTASSQSGSQRRQRYGHEDQIQSMDHTRS